MTKPALLEARTPFTVHWLDSFHHLWLSAFILFLLWRMPLYFFLMESIINNTFEGKSSLPLHSTLKDTEDTACLW